MIRKLVLLTELISVLLGTLFVAEENMEVKK